VRKMIGKLIQFSETGGQVMGSKGRKNVKKPKQKKDKKKK